MRLLNVVDQTFKEFSDQDTPPYIVTSHRWANHETTYQNVKDRQSTSSAGYKKVEKLCAIGREQSERQAHFSNGPCEWMWIDTCCIDKKSSAELCESINSMFSWYRQARYCIAFLADVRPLSAGITAVMDDFKRSEWFKRGWTLQELLAPSCVIFVTRTGETIGHKCSSDANKQSCAGCAEPNNLVLNEQIAEITGVPGTVLWNYEESKTLRPKAKWNWSANRKTTRPEDTAYCLLGIFDVYMPLIYGEGAQHASVRLRQEITKRNKGRQKKPEQRPAPQKSSKPLFGEGLFPPITNAQQNGIPRWCQPLFNSIAFDSSDSDSDMSDRHSTWTNVRTEPNPGWFPRRSSSGRSNSSGLSRINSDLRNPRIPPRSRQGGVTGEYQEYVRRATRAGVSPAQIGAAGGFLPGLDFAALSKVSPARIGAAGEFLPYWDLRALSRLTPGQIAANADAARKSHDRHQNENT